MESKQNSRSMVLPRVIRAFEAPRYLGVDKNRFNKEIRPELTEVPLGDRAIGFDRLDLDSWWEEYKARHGRPSASNKGAKTQWDDDKLPDSSAVKASGTSTKSSTARDFAKALKLVTGKKQKQSLRS